MDSSIAFWFKTVVLFLVLFYLGYLFTALFESVRWARVMGGLGLIGIVVGAFFLGSVAIIQGFETGKIIRLKDGKHDFIITLFLGPFKYSRVIPEVKGIETGEATDG